MQHFSFKSKTVNVQECDITFDDIYMKEYAPHEDLEYLKKANVLMLPDEEFRGHKGCFFPEVAEEFLNYLRDHSEPPVIVDICVKDESFNRVELHSELINLGQMIVQYAVLPIITSIIATYLYEKINKMHRKADEVDTKIEIIVEQDKKSKRITYSGSIENFERAMDTVKSTFEKQD